MLKRLLVVLVALSFSHSAFAASIVSWEAFGVTTFDVTNIPVEPGTPPPFPPQAPPRGTPWALSLQFDPDVRIKTGASSPTSPCYSTPLTGSFTLGSTTYGFGAGSAVFTNSFLPFSNCVIGEPGWSGFESGAIEFWIQPTAVDDPWQLTNAGTFLLASYFDLVHQGGTFPSEPVYAEPGFLLFRNDFFQFGSDFRPLVDQEQTLPVPEPGTFAMLGMGLAYTAARRRRRL